MNKETKELNTKTNDELCALITRLNSQLLESRFKVAVGEVDKTHVIKQIRKTIARCMFIISQRGYDISIGSHGVYFINKKDHKIEDVTKKVQKVLSQPEQVAKESKQQVDKDSKQQVAKDSKQQEVKDSKQQATKVVKEKKIKNASTAKGDK